MTVLIYLDTSTQVGGPDHPRSLRVPMPQKLGSRLVGNHWISERDALRQRSRRAGGTNRPTVS